MAKIYHFWMGVPFGTLTNYHQVFVKCLCSSMSRRELSFYTPPSIFNKICACSCTRIHKVLTVIYNCIATWPKYTIFGWGCHMELLPNSITHTPTCTILSPCISWRNFDRNNFVLVLCYGLVIVCLNLS
jgi:hypothetical protein